jgi:hypothetical protein
MCLFGKHIFCHFRILAYAFARGVAAVYATGLKIYHLYTRDLLHGQRYDVYK